MYERLYTFDGWKYTFFLLYVHIVRLDVGRFGLKCRHLVNINSNIERKKNYKTNILL